MNTTTRRKRDKEQRRANIIRAAERVFFSKGVDTATMDEIAEVAEISKGLLYVYFQSKDELYNAVSLKGLRMLKIAFLRAVRQHDKGLRQAHGIGQAYVTFGQKYPGYFDSIVYQASRNTDATPGTYAEACDRQRDEIIKTVAMAIQQGIRDGSIRPDIEPVQTAIMLWGQMHGVIQVASLKNIQIHYRIDFNQHIRFAFGFITAALRAR